ncbi:hypothetical protein [Clostridium sp. BNL1100]|uniref:hypothetical protein n=1 Tax=Clostridium sp. BNL1100 TaxID=755731 RepID=UPI00024A7AA1|nr:hypothetical protein [Clostridium sp. BNL1100]AEY66617.1 hypothetical protein Clo1100_2446 [Clostridium sp. BNL1100]
MKTMINGRNTTTIDTCKGYRLLWSLTIKNNNQKVVTQDVFQSIESAKDAVYSVVRDISAEYENVKHGTLMLLDESQIQEDGIEYVAHIEGRFSGGSFYIRIITCDNEPDAETITAREIQGRFMELVVDGLGEFKFLFKENTSEDKSQGKYYMEVLWNPIGYGLIDFIVGQYVDDIDSEMINIKEDMSYYIDGARISCICRIESGHDDEGVYEDILKNFFGEECEPDEDNMEWKLADTNERTKKISELLNTKYTKCPNCGSEVHLISSVVGENDGWYVECIECEWAQTCKEE